MSPGRVYETVVEGCGKKPVRFIVAQRLASALTDTHKAEVALTSQGTVVGRKVTYGKQGSKKEQHKRFANVKAATKWFNKKKEVEAALLAQLADLKPVELDKRFI